jgi:hypothetical protein
MLGTILIVFLFLLLVESFPQRPHSNSWESYLSSRVGLVYLIVVFRMVLGGYEVETRA